MSLNVKMLRKIKKHILAEPKRFGMNAFGVVGEPGERVRFAGGGGLAEPELRTLPACGTVACIAGWAVLLKDGRKKFAAMLKDDPGGEEIQCRAEEILGPDTCVYGIFSVHNWPFDLKLKYAKAKTWAQRAKVAAERIDRFIQAEVEE